ncbi:hypothetical protein [Hoeflea sp.]|uniref:helix-turn-helix transcriptional regulator n=1 Tax=Hoeflea sp. TaxID=1940281 RepID=UPI0019C1FC49|nr:hypothetical protein [Hoeflea sp.]MBC7285841.1 hypothetical protein [Hoeflea sp.]
MTDIIPRLLTRSQAAAYCGCAPSTFSMWVAGGTIPPAVPGTKRWDRAAIDAKLDAISGLATAETEDAYDKWVRENEQPDHRPAAAETALSEWKKQQKKREKRRPQMGLDANHERVLIYMVDYPQCDIIDIIPRAGPAVIAHLVKKGAVKRLRHGRLEVTDEGRQEVARIRKWNKGG